MFKPANHTLITDIFRKVSHPIFRGLFHLLVHVQVEGVENVPAQHGYLVTPNHVSIYDPPFVLTFWPRPLEIAGAEAVLERPVQGQLMRLYGALHVQRSGYNRTLLEDMIRLLKAGFPVYLAPEGRRSHQAGMVAAWPGAAYVAAKADVPVVPVGVVGTDGVLSAWKAFRRPYLKMTIGAPLKLPRVDFHTRGWKEVLQQNTHVIMKAIASLLPPEYHGVYR